MTQARTRANEVGSPSPRQLSLAAMLRAFVELVLHAASTLRMCIRNRLRDWHTGSMPAALPGEANGIQQQETELAAPQGSSKALMLRDREAIVSKHEGVLTTQAILTESFSALCRESRLAHHRDRPFLVPLIPAKAGTQSNNGIRAAILQSHTSPWIPAFAGMSGVCVRTVAPA